MTIVAVTPVDRERLVPVTTAIIQDYMATSSTGVWVNDVQVFNGVAALAGWSFISISFPGGTRIVLDPPSSFSVGDVVRVRSQAADGDELDLVFQCGLRQITTTDDASVPRITETSDDPIIAYSRAPGNIYLRRDEPLTSEVLLVPGDNVDVGFNETTNKFEVMYVHNGKVFVITGDPGDAFSTLAQPSILKTNVSPGTTGDFSRNQLSLTDFPPVKIAVPSDPVFSGDTGDGYRFSLTSPPNSPQAFALLSDSATTVVVAPSQSTLIKEILLYKINTGAATLIASLPYSTQIQIFIDNAYMPGDRYFTQAVHGDPWSSVMNRFADRSVDTAGTPGDIVTTGDTGDFSTNRFTFTDFPPLKIAVPSDFVFSGDTGDAAGDDCFHRNWFPASGTAASLGAPVGGFIVVTGLTAMSRQHFGLTLTISGAATPSNNGEFQIVEVISATSVRIRALLAAGSDANNGALTWTATGPTVVQSASFITRNTLNIGVGS